AWMRTLGSKTANYIAKRKSKTNLYYWAGYSLGVSGLILNDASYQDRSRKIFEEALSSIQSDGTLPNELVRGRRSALYHAFAAQAIFGLALLHEKNFKKLDEGPFGRLADLLTEASSGSS